LHAQNFNPATRAALAIFHFLTWALVPLALSDDDDADARTKAGNRKTPDQSQVLTPKPETAYGLIRNVTPIKELGFHPVLFFPSLSSEHIAV
jgi:hypothetical protein